MGQRAETAPSHRHPQEREQDRADGEEKGRPEEDTVNKPCELSVEFASAMQRLPSVCTSQTLKLAAQLTADDDDERRESLLSKASNMYAPQLGIELPTLGMTPGLASSNGSSGSLAAFRF